MRVAVTGGGGYVGYHVGWVIAQGGHEVILIDLAPPDPEWRTTAPQVLFDALPKGFWGEADTKAGELQYVKANITSYPCLREIFQGVSAVIHTASYGISGEEQLSAHMTKQEEVNIMGTRTVLRAAVDAQVRALVYTSTYNVVFGGKEIRDGDENLPIFPLHCHSDNYSRTKSIAEMLVLMANGKCLEKLTGSSQSGPIPASGDPSVNTCSPTLRTCALRLAGVMGLGERRHSSRVIDALQSGFLCTFGRAEILVDFAGIQNVAQAHVKAMMALLKEQAGQPFELKNTESDASREPQQRTSEETPENLKNKKQNDFSVGLCNKFSGSKQLNIESCDISRQVSGNTFFISDESPINHFEYFRPWYEGLGYGFPNVRLPLFLIMIVAHIQQNLYFLVHKIFRFKPFIAPAEVYKSGVTHYFSCKKAESYFGYKPSRPNDQSQIVEYYKRKGCTKSNEKTSRFKTFVFSALFVFLMSIIFQYML